MPSTPGRGTSHRPPLSLRGHRRSPPPVACRSTVGPRTPILSREDASGEMPRERLPAGRRPRVGPRHGGEARRPRAPRTPKQKHLFPRTQASSPAPAARGRANGGRASSAVGWVSGAPVVRAAAPLQPSSRHIVGLQARSSPSFAVKLFPGFS